MRSRREGDWFGGAGDPRRIEFRVRVADGQPKEIEIFVRLRNFDQSADAPKPVKFPWPA